MRLAALPDCIARIRVFPRGLLCFAFVGSTCFVACTSIEMASNSGTSTPTTRLTEGIFFSPITVIDDIQMEAHDLAVTPQGTIWILSDQNLIHFEQGHTMTTTTPYIFDGIEVASDDSVWAYNPDRLAHFSGASWQVFVPSQGLEGSTILNIAVAPNGRIWVMLKSKEFSPKWNLTIFDAHTWQTATFSSPRSDGFFFLSGFDNRGRPWVTWHSAAAYLESSQWVTVSENIGSPTFASDGSRWAELWGEWYQILPNRGPSTSVGWVDTTVALYYQSASGIERCFLQGPLITTIPSNSEPLGIFSRSIVASAQIEISSPILGHEIRAFTVGPDNTLWAITEAIDKSEYGSLGFSDLNQATLASIDQTDELICFANGKWKTYSIGDKAREIKSISASFDGTLWVVTSRSIQHIRVPSGDYHAASQ